MRKSQLIRIMSVITDMHTAHYEIKTTAEAKNLNRVQNQMCDLQEIAYSLGNIIGKSEGEEVSAVAYLERYCEVLYLQLEGLIKGSTSPKQVYEILEEALQMAENSIKNDITVRKEIVFFPYKASMWDSLESLYLKLKENPDNDVYCVPIPYYELNLDQTLGEKHYEGHQFPANIEITDYNAYRFEDRRPDEIYIHNPYDNFNLVTQVDSRFFSSNLKKYTDKLVYSPYFVLREIEPDDQLTIDGMKHFIWLPGVLFADEVILQSEKMKQIYINEYIKAAKKSGLSGNHINRKYLENKFKGTGSPKLERAIRTQKEEVEIPKEWEHILQKPDGSKKKVIFYNTGIAALLQNNEKWVDKIEDSFKIFKENSDKVALLWRPHPLIENTMKSMRPGIRQKYMQIKEQYIQAGWGIYDDTPELDRAIAISDAYYGDASSVVELFRAVGKKTMIASMDLRIDPNADCHNIRVSPAAFCVNDSDVWLVHDKFNVIFKYNMISKETQMYSLNPHGELARQSQFCGIHIYSDKLFIVPCWGKEILVFDTVSLKAHVMQGGTVEAGSFIRSCVMGKYLYCIPFYGEYFLKIDMEKECVVKKIKWKDSENTAAIFINWSFESDNTIYCIAPNMGNKILKLKNDMLQIIKINGAEDRYISCAAFNGKMYLYGYNSQTVYEYDDVQNKPLNTYKLATGSCKFTYINDDVLLHESGDRDKLFCVIKDDGCSEINVSSKDNGGYRTWYRSGISVIDRGVCFYYDRRENILYSIDKDYKVKKHEIWINLEGLKGLNETVNNMFESEIYGLLDMVKAVQLEK